LTEEVEVETKMIPMVGEAIPISKPLKTYPGMYRDHMSAVHVHLDELKIEVKALKIMVSRLIGNKNI